MMTFDLDKSKIIKTKIRVQNVDEHNVDFIFRLMVDGVEYGFNGLMENGIVFFKIPALRDIVGNVSVNEEYPIRIDSVAGDRFFQRPWQDTAKFKSVPKLELEEVVDEEGVVEQEITVTEIEESDGDDIVKRFKEAEKEILKEKDDDPEIEVPEKKSKKFTQFMEHGTLDEATKLKALLKEARRKKNDSKED
ncbi:MAG: hypothetical protein ACW99Q_08950 [Candidatus Kariarchaeaceae archaeon]